MELSSLTFGQRGRHSAGDGGLEYLRCWIGLQRRSLQVERILGMKAAAWRLARRDEKAQLSS